jgi:hypothetical protein
MRDFYISAVILEDHIKLVIRYKFNEINFGELQLSNSVQYLKKRTIQNLKKVLHDIEPYITEYFFISIQ